MMPRYYFHLCNDLTVPDVDGTEFADLDQARGHAIAVARELTFRSSGMLGQAWSQWTMSVRDAAAARFFP